MVGRHLIQNEAPLDLVKVNCDCIFDKAIVKEIHLLKRYAHVPWQKSKLLPWKYCEISEGIFQSFYAKLRRRSGVGGMT